MTGLGVGTAKNRHCKQNVTVSGIISIRRSFYGPKNCHCSQNVTVTVVTVLKLTQHHKSALSQPYPKSRVSTVTTEASRRLTRRGGAGLKWEGDNPMPTARSFKARSRSLGNGKRYLISSLCRWIFLPSILADKCLPFCIPQIGGYGYVLLGPMDNLFEYIFVP